MCMDSHIANDNSRVEGLFSEFSSQSFQNQSPLEERVHIKSNVDQPLKMYNEMKQLAILCKKGVPELCIPRLFLSITNHRVALLEDPSLQPLP